MDQRPPYVHTMGKVSDAWKKEEYLLRQKLQEQQQTTDPTREPSAIYYNSFIAQRAQKELEKVLLEPERFDLVEFPPDMLESDEAWDAAPVRARRYMRDLLDMGITDKTSIYPEEMHELRRKYLAREDVPPEKKFYSPEAEAALDYGEYACGRFRDYYRRCLRDLNVGPDDPAPRVCVAQAFNVWKCWRRLLCGGEEVQHKMFCDPTTRNNTAACGLADAMMLKCMAHHNLAFDSVQEMADVFRRNIKNFGTKFGPNLLPEQRAEMQREAPPNASA